MANDNPRQTKRLEFHRKLESIPGVRKAYFQRPSNKGMIYPCILYKAEPKVKYYANNMPYMMGTNYTVYYIHTDPDDEVVDYIVQHFQYASHDQQYIADGLYHDVYNIFYK